MSNHHIELEPVESKKEFVEKAYEALNGSYTPTTIKIAARLVDNVFIWSNRPNTITVTAQRFTPENHCEWCGKKIERKPRGPAAKYCSAKCTDAARYNKWIGEYK